MTITTAEILDALANAARGQESAPTPDDVHTGHEIREAMGWCLSTFSREMRALKAAGQLEVVKVHREGLDGRMGMVPAYRFLAPRPLTVVRAKRAAA